MKSKIVAAFATLMFFGIATPVEAATVSSTDSFDPSTGLWTYNYVVDNTSGVGLITHLDILVASTPTPPPNYIVTGLILPPYTAPSGWTMSHAGSYYEFFSGDSNGQPNGCCLTDMIQVGATASFSITTTFGPTLYGGQNDYFLFGYNGTFVIVAGIVYPLSSVVGVGNVIIPSSADWTYGPNPNPSPLPSTLPLFATGLGALGLLGWRRKWKAQPA